MEKPTASDLLQFGASGDPRPNAEHLPLIFTALQQEDRGDLATIGAAIAMHDQFPDAEFWKEPAGAAFLQQALAKAANVDADGAEWNRYYLGRYGVLGDDADLKELIRRARNRDGSTATLVTGTEALVMLSDGMAEHPATVGAALKRLGFDPGNVKTGSYPATTSPAPSAILAPAPGSNALTPSTDFVVQQVPAPAPPPAVPVVISTPGGIINVGVDTNHGKVVVSGIPISISAAIALETDLVKRTRELLIPTESYAWFDEFDHSKGQLVTEDVPPASDPNRNVFGRGLPRPDPSASLAIHGDVLQDKTTSRYSCRLYNRQGGGGFTQIADGIEDYNDAKFRVAAAAKAELISVGLLKP